MFISRIGRLFALAALLAPVAATAQPDTLELFVTSESHVFQLDGAGHYGVFATTSADHWPLALVFDRSGYLYVSVTGTGDIRKFGRNGEDLGVFATIGGSAAFSDLVFDTAGNLYGSRFSNNEIWRFAPDGTAVLFAVTGDGPVGLTIDDGHLFVALLNSGGGAIVEYSLTDAALLDRFDVRNPLDVVFASGMLWVTSGATHDVRRYTTAGDLVDVFAGGLTGPQQLTFDSAGNVYVADNPASVIRRFSPTGADLGALFPPLYFPYGVAVRPAEIELVVDIKPGSCRNPFNVDSRGVLPVAVVGTAALDVTRIDISTLRLAGVIPDKAAIADVVTPGQGGLCGAEAPDGRKDLVLHFRTADIVAALAGPFVDGTQRRLTLTGTLKPQFGGARIAGSDVVELIAKK